MSLITVEGRNFICQPNFIPGHLGQAAPWHRRHRAGVDANLEARRRPLHELNRPLRLHNLDSRVDILGHGVPSEEQNTGHVLSFNKQQYGKDQINISRTVV